MPRKAFIRSRLAIFFNNRDYYKCFILTFDTLTKIVKTRKAGIDFIILSGYADFNYAREAIHYGAKDYLLKPLDEESLINVVLKCRDERRKQQFMKDIRLTPLMENGKNTGSFKHTYSQTIMKIMKLVEEEIGNEELSLKWISAQKLFLNENYLSKVFQKEVGQKFSAYLLERRMMLAMQLLANDADVLITDVANATGFGDNPQYFSSSFKKYTGYTPTEYKKNMKEAQEN